MDSGNHASPPRLFIIRFSLLLIFIFLIFLIEYGLGLVNNIQAKRSERTRFISETAPLLTSANHLIPNLDDTFINEQKSGSALRRMRTDKYGLVMGEGLNAKSGREFKIVFLGGSTTENNEVDEAFRFPFHTGIQLSKITGDEFLGINAGIRGHTSQDSINLYINHPAPDIQDAKIVVMMHNINDRLKLSIDGGYKSRIDNKSKISIAGFIESFLVMVSTFKDFFVFNTNVGYVVNEAFIRLSPPTQGRPYINERILDELPPISEDKLKKFTQNYKNFQALAKANGQRPIFMTQPLGRKSSYQEQFNDEIRHLGAAEGVPVIDLAKYILDVDNYESLFYGDGIHFNNDGSRWAANVIADRLGVILELKDLRNAGGGQCNDLKLSGNSFLNQSAYSNIFPGRYPSFNSGEDKILFQVNNKDGSLIAYLDLKSGEISKLIFEAGSDALEHPTWFSDDVILYTKKTSSKRDVFLLNILTGETKPLLNKNWINSTIPFVGPGGEILFAGYGEKWSGVTPPSLYKMSSLDSAPEVLFSNSYDSWRPVMGGAHEVLFINNKTGKYQVYELNLNDDLMQEAPLSASEGTQWDPITSTDGRYVAYAERGKSDFDIFIFDRKSFSTMKRQRLLSSTSNEWDPRFSPTGAYLLYSVSTHHGDQIRAFCLTGLPPPPTQ